MSLEILKKQIKSKTIQNIYLFYGPEEYLKRYYINTITDQIIDEETKELNYICIDGKTDAESIIEHCETMPVFSERKLVVAKNTGFFKAKKGDNDGSKDKLSSYLESIPSYTCLIFAEAEIDKRKKLVNSIKKHGLIVELDFQKPADLVKWVIKVFKSYNKSIDQMSASYIVENSEYAMTELLNEIEKLSNYVGAQNTITLKDAELICTKTIKSRIFDLTDSISEGNISKALTLLSDMAALKEPMQKVMFMIIRQIKMLYRIKLLNRQGLPESIIIKQLGLTPYVASKVMSASRKLDIEVLEKAMYYSLELDESIKTGKITDRIAIELLIASIGK